MPNIPEELMQMLKQSHSNKPRQYGDFRITSFDCGCVLAVSIAAPNVTEIKNVCNDHAKYVNNL
ncbi:MAG TPA: hypothetical protein VJH04_01865 [archaeon]|nr:hypothetical protein [archaeon]